MKKKEEITNINLETDRLFLKRPTMTEQYDLWNIQKQREVYRYYMSIPARFNNNREAFEHELNDWELQKKWYQLKIDNLDEDSDKYTWSIFLKNGEVIGQMTVQPNSNYDDLAIRNIGWYINPKYQGLGYATEAAMKIIEFMFNVVEIDSIVTEANVVNCGSWKLMEKLGFERTGESVSNHIDDEGKNLMQYNYLLTKEEYEINKENNYKKGR